MSKYKIVQVADTKRAEGEQGRLKHPRSRDKKIQGATLEPI